MTNEKLINFAKDIRILRIHILLLLPLDLWSLCLSKNEHEPIHVHVLHGGKESIFDLIMMNGELAETHVREKHGAEPLPEKDKRTAEQFVRRKVQPKNYMACADFSSSILNS